MNEIGPSTDGENEAQRQKAQSENQNIDRFLTLADVAEILNISPRQVYALLRSGELPAIKIGGNGQWRIERSVLESFIEAKYEETRRLSLWNQSNYAELAEYSFGKASDLRDASEH